MPAMAAPMNRIVDTFSAAVRHLEELHLRRAGRISAKLLGQSETETDEEPSRAIG